jgi:2-succinyl-5-enolpyruvyl-6-hydroxy-3-cyclohexene-1-carboxylate synthase
MKLRSSPNINYLWANLMIEELIRNGVDYYCISPGSRSSPLAWAVANHKNASAHVHWDERGSAFHALGYVSAARKACAIITTSGTAAANLFPAIIEASKKKIPLIVITADRPPELRFTGAHQTIDQTKIYGEHVRWYFDLPCPTPDIPPEFILTTIDQAVSRAKGNPGGPVHLNCMFREPLAPIKKAFRASTSTPSMKTWQAGNSPYTKYLLPKFDLVQSDINQILSTIGKIRSGIIVAGKLSTLKEQRAVLKMSERLNWPIFPDISSGLRLGQLHKNVIHYFDQILLSDNLQKHFPVDGIFHFGGRMTSRRWYDYVQAIVPEHYIMALKHPLRNDPLHNVTLRIHGDVGSLANALLKKIPQRKSNKLLSKLQKLNSCVDQAIENYFGKTREINEPQTARLITQHIPAQTALFVASSMPIREIDTYGVPTKNSVLCDANQGASGIDGTIATAIGFDVGLQKRTTLLIGDLAFLYDLNSLGMARALKHPLVIVVLNNNGGGIFSFLPVNNRSREFEKFFGTPHNLTFHAAADLFDLNYCQPETPEQFVQSYSVALKSRTTTIIEIRSNRARNLEIHDKLQDTIKKAIRKILK